MIERDDAADAFGSELVELMALIRRVVAARVGDRDAVDEIVQETVTRLLAARGRLAGRALGPYAIVTARNLVVARWRRADVERRHQHRLVDTQRTDVPDEEALRKEEAEALHAALERLAPHERDVLVAHVVEGRGTGSLAGDLTSTPAAVAAQLGRSRAKLRVEYLLEVNGPPPTSQCRPVLLSLSIGDRRRQAALDAGYHLLDCDYCASMSAPLFDWRSKADPDEVRCLIVTDRDVVLARQRGRELTVAAGFSASEATAVATAISEIARNIVRFARRGEVMVTRLENDGADGVMVVAQDAGPGIADIQLALTEGHSTYGGRGIGLPGCRRLMDEFEISSEVGRGTIVTMTKWHMG